jgi:hypothetical protein
MVKVNSLLPGIKGLMTSHPVAKPIVLYSHQTADIRQAYHLSFIKHTAAVLEAGPCDSFTPFVSNF